jgi:HPt (histidine-containing phosphotransfer) domain-containing protein
LKRFVRDKQPQEIIDAAHREKGGYQIYTANGNGKLSVTPEFIEIFVRNAERLAAELEEIQKNDGVYKDEDLCLYTINTHSLKTMLANAGEKALSAAALKLEQAGREKDTAVITKETHGFLNELRAVIRKFTPQNEGETGGETGDEETEYLREKLLAIKGACEAYNRKTAKAAITELRQKEWSRETTEILEKMAEHLLNGDFDKVSSIAGNRSIFKL